MFDISRLAGYFVTQYTVKNATVTPQVLIPPNTSRPILYITNQSTFTLYMSLVGFPATGTFFEWNVPTNSVRQFTWILDGILPTLGFNVWSSGGPTNFSYTEVLWQPPQTVE